MENSLTISGFEQTAVAHSWFLENPNPQERHDIIYYGLNEEIDELLRNDTHPESHIRMLWGQETTDPEHAAIIAHQFEGEAGDVLYYLTAGCMLHEVALETVCERGVAIVAGHEQAITTISDIDSLLSDKMEQSKPVSYKPSYFQMQFFGAPAFHRADGDWHTPYEPTNSQSLQLVGDGLYALERTLRDASEFIGGYPREQFITNSGLAIAALSIVLQNRFDSSLDKAAHRYITKAERRARNAVQQEGADEERSRPVGQERERLSGWAVTLSALRLFE